MSEAEDAKNQGNEFYKLKQYQEGKCWIEVWLVAKKELILLLI